MKLIKTKQAFTLVELLVVVVIISLLSTLWFMKLSGYLEWVRDTKRVAQITEINQALEMFSTDKLLPIPHSKIDILNGTWVIAYQWDIWKSILNILNFEGEWIDPKSGEFYTYEIDEKRKHYELMVHLEKSESFAYSDTIFNQAMANDKIKYFPYVLGDKLWILTWVDLNKTPIHRLSEVTSVWNIDISTVSNSYIAYLDNQIKIEWNSMNLNILGKVISVWGRLFTSCDEILLDNSNYKGRPGYYAIIPDWYNVVETYCNF